MEGLSPIRAGLQVPFKGPVHGTYHRLEYFVTNHLGIVAISSSNIGSAVWSDHMPVFLVIAASSGNSVRSSWKLNDNLLFDEACVAEIRTAILNFTKDHVRDTTSLSIQWEALKCVVRGLFIKHGSRLKKAKGNRIAKLSKEITKLETQHKQTPLSAKLIKLTEKRSELRSLLNEQTMRVRDKNRTLYYQQGNKPGKLLARALRQ